jgi:hypothetical protein
MGASAPARRHPRASTPDEQYWSERVTADPEGSQCEAHQVSRPAAHLCYAAPAGWGADQGRAGRLGHKRREMTLHIYAHALPSRPQDAAVQLAALLHSGGQPIRRGGVARTGGRPRHDRTQWMSGFPQECGRMTRVARPRGLEQHRGLRRPGRGMPWFRTAGDRTWRNGLRIRARHAPSDARGRGRAWPRRRVPVGRGRPPHPRGSPARSR